MKPTRNIQWDFREQHRVDAITERESESGRRYKIIPGPADVVLLLPNNIKVAERARQIHIWHDDGKISFVDLCGEEAATDAVFQQGLGLMKKYEAPQTAIDKFTEWHRVITNNERFGSFEVSWKRNQIGMGIEVRDSYDSKTPWYCKFVVDFYDVMDPDLRQ